MEKAIEVTITQENASERIKQDKKNRNTDRRTTVETYRNLLLSTTQYSRKKRGGISLLK